MPLNYIDLFAGCGGLSLGLYNAGWHGLFAVEKNADAFLTLSSLLSGYTPRVICRAEWKIPVCESI